MKYYLVLGVLLLTLAGSRPTKAVFSVRSYCEFLKYHIKVVGAEGSDAKTLLVIATRELRKWNPLIYLGVGSSGQLIKAWKKAAHEKKCDGSSLKAVVTLRACGTAMPKTKLTDATNKYAKRCLTSTYLAEKIRSVAGQSTEGPESFMDETFLTTYRADNPHEPSIHSNAYCCKPKLAYNAIFKSIESHKDEAAIKDRKSLENYLESNLFIPCQNYYNRAKELMEQISDAFPIHISGEQLALVNAMSQESKDTIFRFNMCDILQYRQKEVVDEVARRLGYDNK